MGLLFYNKNIENIFTTNNYYLSVERYIKEDK